MLAYLYRCFCVGSASFPMAHNFHGASALIQVVVTLEYLRHIFFSTFICKNSYSVYVGLGVDSCVAAYSNRYSTWADFQEGTPAAIWSYWLDLRCLPIHVLETYRDQLDSMMSDDFVWTLYDIVIPTIDLRYLEGDEIWRGNVSLIC